jgi:hypothetical protein
MGLEMCCMYAGNEKRMPRQALHGLIHGYFLGVRMRFSSGMESKSTA